ncbi:carbohydrate kinase [Pauljensenia sp. UMB3104]|uniref:carbohydrate kinase family protein n=1 Tax=Pauljensenia sp. UMB3104 TaxID=3046331 RepID=UPI00255085AA|nr:carbohydrate kinase [Pauljensenia sp. UMB3104]MDK7160016.1 carbohydrate kinase [Pauljensenia sp. UMB3104]
MTVQSGPHILAIGEALIDVVITHEQPDFPVEIPGGSPANVALTLGRLDRPVALATWIGLDERGRLIDFHMNDSGVHVTAASRGASHTSTALARLDESGAASYTFDLEWAPTPPIKVPPTAQILEAGSISAIIEPGASAVLDALTRGREHALVCFDPNARPSIMGEPEAALASLERFIALADVVKVSDEDIEWLTGGAPIDEVVDRWLGMGPSLVVVTRGKHGSDVATASGLRFTKTPADVPVVDTVGAGDSFMGGIIDAMWGMGLRGADARETLRTLPEEQVRAIIDRASAVSDVTVSRKGANPPWAHELA